VLKSCILVATLRERVTRLKAKTRIRVRLAEETTRATKASLLKKCEVRSPRYL